MRFSVPGACGHRVGGFNSWVLRVRTPVVGP